MQYILTTPCEKNDISSISLNMMTNTVSISNIRNGNWQSGKGKYRKLAKELKSELVMEMAR